MEVKNITNEMKQCIISDHLSGIRLKDISEKYDILTPRIIRLLKNEGCFNPSTNRWTKSELEYLKNNYSCATWEEIEKNLPGRDRSNIFTKASNLGLSRIGVEFALYSEYEDNIIRQYYISHGAKYISENILKCRTEKSVSTRAKRIGATSKPFWSEKEDKILIENYDKMPVNMILPLLPNRTREAIIDRAKLFNIQSYSLNPFTNSDYEFIKNNYLQMSDVELGEALDRTKQAIKTKRNMLGLHRPRVNCSFPDYIRAHNYFWKQDSMRACGYKCVLTGKRFDDIHHLYGLNLIMNETCKELGIDLTFDINSATDDYKDLILETFYKIQAKYPLGVCLSKEVHMAFHNKYGYGNNTPEQFEEFASTYKTTC